MKHLILFTTLHDQLGTRLKGIFGNDAEGELAQLFAPNSISGSLLSQLERVNNEEEINEPPNVRLFIGDILGGPLSPLLQGFETQFTFPFPLFPPLNLVQQLRNLLQQDLPFFGPRVDALSRLITARDPNSIKTAGEQMFSNGNLWDRLKSFIGTDPGAILPLATIASAVPANKQGSIVEATERALLDYFFKKKGYETVDGASVVAPIHLSDVASSVTDASSLKNMFSQATAEHYLRNTIRVALEAIYDTVRDLRGKYKDVEEKLKSRQPDTPKQAAVETKFVNWFRGFSSTAESASMRGVEIATQGVSEFQTNPLIAAAAGSFAGTVARKIAQDSFLKVLRNDLG